MKKARESRKNLRKKIARLPPACLERKAPSCFWTILRTDFERKHGKIVPAVSQRPNFLLPFSVSRFPNRFFCFFLFLVAASSRSMLLQLLQRLHLFFFLDYEYSYTVRLFPLLSATRVLLWYYRITKSEIREEQNSLSLSLVSKNSNNTTFSSNVGAFVRFRRA